jgi:hypothetical protein
MHQDIHELSGKREVIARVLVAHGVTIWSGLPEAILEGLREHGYRVKKRKRVKAKN